MYFSQVYESWEGLQNQKYEGIFSVIGLDFLSGKLVLDVGSGKGYLEKFLADKNVNAKIVCLDIDKNTKPDVFGDGNNLPFRNECFDIVISIDTMHLLHSNDFSRVLKDNGLALLATFFNDSNYEERKHMLKEKLSSFQIIHEFEIRGRENEYVIIGRRVGIENLK